MLGFALGTATSVLVCINVYAKLCSKFFTPHVLVAPFSDLFGGLSLGYAQRPELFSVTHDILVHAVRASAFDSFWWTVMFYHDYCE